MNNKQYNKAYIVKRNKQTQCKSVTCSLEFCFTVQTGKLYSSKGHLLCLLIMKRVAFVIICCCSPEANGIFGASMPSPPALVIGGIMLQTAVVNSLPAFLHVIMKSSYIDTPKFAIRVSTETRPCTLHGHRQHSKFK